MNAVDARKAGIASGVNNAVSRTAGLLAIAVLSLVMLHVFNRGLDRRLSGLNLPASTQKAIEKERVKLGAAEAPAAAGSQTRLKVKDAVGESFVAGFRRVMLIAAGLALLSALVAWLLISGSTAKP
jgi:hypothetical protein